METDATGADEARGLEPSGQANALGLVGAAVATKAWSVLLVAALALGPVGAVLGGWAWYRQAASPAVSNSVAAADRSDDQEVAAEMAQRVVVAWLTATQDRPGELVALVKDASLVGLAQQPAQVRDLAVAAVVRRDLVWTVTVAATVTDTRQTARRYFQVPVMVSGGTVTVLTLPAPVAGPSVALASTTYRTQLAAGSAAGVTVSQFLSAYLAGSGDLSRYLTPGLSLAAITPAPYTAVRLVELRSATTVDAGKTLTDGQQLRVLAVATAQVSDRESAAVEYALTLKARAGRWEISAIDPSPAVGSAPPAPAATVSQTSSATSSPRPTSSTS